MNWCKKCATFWVVIRSMNPAIYSSGTIRPVQSSDAAAIAGLYNHYIEHTTITFEESMVTAEEMARRISSVTPAYPWYVWEESGEVKGYAYGHAYHERSAFRNTVECAIYVHHGAVGRRIGRSLYGALLDLLKAQGFHVAIGAIALPNEPSVRLHEQLGFQPVGRLAEVGLKFGRWIDVGYWQKTL